MTNLMKCIPIDLCKNRLKKYFSDRKEIIKASKELQEHIVTQLDPTQSDPSIGFNRLASLRKFKHCNTQFSFI